jgi:hypothetical protein
VIKECLQLLRSEAMFLTLSNLTGLSLHPLAVTHSDSNASETDSENEDKAVKKDDNDNDASDSGSEKVIKRKRRKLSASSESKKAEKDAGEKAADNRLFLCLLLFAFSHFSFCII